MKQEVKTQLQKHCDTFKLVGFSSLAKFCHDFLSFPRGIYPNPLPVRTFPGPVTLLRGSWDCPSVPHLLLGCWHDCMFGLGRTMVTHNYNEKLDFHNLLMSRCKSAPRPVPKGEPLSFSGLHFFLKAVIRVEHKAN